MAADALYGWDLTFKTVERDIRRKSDVLIAFIHWNLSKRGFRTIGIGDERTLTGDEDSSEVLPTGWNDKDNYTLRYVLDGKLYILHGLTTDGNLIVNLMRSHDLAVSNIAVTIDESVKETSGSIDKMIPNNKELMFNVKRDLIDTITERSVCNVETQTSSRNNAVGTPALNAVSGWVLQNALPAHAVVGVIPWMHPFSLNAEPAENNHRRPPDDPLRVPQRPPIGPHPDSRDLWELPPARMPNIGGSDLDPFAPAGGGMLFNPFGPRRDPENPGLGIPGGLPRGAVPPGARFDPFGPPMGPPMPGQRQPPPDADHLPPPGGFNDHNMFM